MLAAILNCCQTVIGFLTDAASATGTAMARLAYIISYLSGTILNYLNGTTAIPGLGQQGDAANSTGTANAKLQYLIANLLGVEPAVVLGRTVNPGYYATTSASLQNVLNISGRGSLTYLAASWPSGTTAGTFKLTMDGTVIINTPYQINWTGTLSYSVSGAALAMLNTAPMLPASLDFKSSLLIQLASDGTRVATCEYVFNQ